MTLVSKGGHSDWTESLGGRGRQVIIHPVADAELAGTGDGGAGRLPRDTRAGRCQLEYSHQ